MDATPQQRLLGGIAAAAGITPEIIERPGTSIRPAEDRRGSGLAVFYQFGDHTMIWCDPEAVPFVTNLESDSSTAEAAVRAFASHGGYEVVGGAVMKTMGRFVSQGLPAGRQLHRFDWNNAADVERMQRLVDASTEDDLDEAEVAMDDLDDVAVGLIDSDGGISAYASMRPFEYEPNLGDIGVIVRDGHRGEGLGSAAVALLVERALPDGWDPLYRCDPWENPGSDRLSTRLGFEPVIELLAIRAVTAEG